MIDDIYGAEPPSGGGLGKVFKAIGGALGSINPLIGAGLLSGIGSLGASLFGNSMGMKQSKELMDYQFMLQQKAIDAQNLYNSPVEQMKRLNAAGLNPNLVYGNGVDGNQSGAANPSMSNRNVDLANPLQDMAENVRASRLLDIQEKNSEVERAYTAAKTVGQLWNNKYLSESLKDRLQLVAADLANTLEDTNLKRSNISLNASRANNLEELTRKYASDVDLNKARTITERMRPAEIKANIALIKAKTNLTKKQMAVADSVIALNGAKVQAVLAQALYYGANASYIGKKSVFQGQLNKIGAGNMSNKDKVKTLVDLARIVAGFYQQGAKVGASAAGL